MNYKNMQINYTFETAPVHYHMVPIQWIFPQVPELILPWKEWLLGSEFK